MGRWISAVALGLAVLVGPFACAVSAQQVSFGTVASSILTIDSERLFLESAFGQRVADDIEREGATLAAEHRKIEAELAKEEERLTAQRPSMDAEEFRKIADAFDTKVQTIRRERAAKSRALNQRLSNERDVFLTAAAPVLERLMREKEAAVILERRSVFLSVNAIDVTSAAIKRLDATLGAGTGVKP